jgi:hypothetical protein
LCSKNIFKSSSPFGEYWGLLLLAKLRKDYEVWRNKISKEESWKRLMAMIES